MNKNIKYITNKHIYCENEFCIYQQDNNCILENLELDISGQCLSCNLVSLDADELYNAKQSQLNKN